MKKSIIFSLALVIISVISANAQGFQLGIKGGANINKIDGRALTDEFKYGYSLGGFAVIKINKHIGIQPEVLWNQFQTKSGHTANDVYNDLSIDNNISLNYLSIPLLLNLSPSKIISFQVGPQYGILINQSQTTVDNAKNAFKKGDFSMIGGVQLNLAWIKLGARYFVGLNNLYDLGNEDKWKNQGFQFYVGVKII